MSLQHYFSAVWLRATSTAGSWAALLALIGLPSRPILTLMVYANAVLITIVALKRLRGDPTGDSMPEERGEHGSARRACLRA